MPSAAAAAPNLESIRYLKGVGPQRAIAFEKIGIRSIQDLLYCFPRRYEDRSQFFKIANLIPGQTATLRGEILSVQFKPIRRMPVVEITVGDDSGFIHALWFNQVYLKKTFLAGQKIILFGKIENYQGRIQISSPDFEIIDDHEDFVHMGRITPIYSLTEGLFQKSLRHLLKDTVDKYLQNQITEFLPESLREKYHFMDLQTAIKEMHFPSSLEIQREAQRRLVFDEFFLFELNLLRKMEKIRTKYRAIEMKNLPSLLTRFKKTLPFELTGAQEQAIQQIVNDLSTTVPTNRLLQGDVGSGKTVVGSFALLAASENQQQAAFLVPTEILAEQHYKTLVRLLSPFTKSIALLTSSTPKDKRERMLAELRQGKLSILIGTHAILQEEVSFKSLVLLIIDEQHKFGVHQRHHLLNREPRPHQIVMTATPIPRTLALTIYGDLDISSIHELPKGRKKIETFWITRKKQKEILQHILKKINEGDQAYFIFPLIEETEKIDLLAAKAEYDKLRKGIFRNTKMGLIHGKLESEERNHIMRGFSDGEIKILVATSVIEVGVDNPNATLMVIENAERFGLSQLHQMRGRIGRGEKPSACFLFGEPKTEEGQKRLRIMTKTQDGFIIADEDLKLRGPGEFLGTRQSGEPLFRLANPILDQDLLIEARNLAKTILKEHWLQTSEEWRLLRAKLEQYRIKY